MSSSASSWVLSESISCRFFSWFKCILWICYCPWMIHTISPIQLRIVPSSQYGIFLFKFFKKSFWPGRNHFLVTRSVVSILDCFVIDLSTADVNFPGEHDFRPVSRLKVYLGSVLYDTHVTIVVMLCGSVFLVLSWVLFLVCRRASPPDHSILGGIVALLHVSPGMCDKDPWIKPM